MVNILKKGEIDMAKETKKYDEDYLNSLIAKAEKSWEGVDVDSFMSDLRDEEDAEELQKAVERLRKAIEKAMEE